MIEFSRVNKMNLLQWCLIRLFRRIPIRRQDESFTNEILTEVGINIEIGDSLKSDGIKKISCYKKASKKKYSGGSLRRRARL